MAAPPMDHHHHQHLHVRPPPPSSKIAPPSTVRSLPMLLPVFVLFFVLLCFLSVFLCRDLLHFASLWLHRRRGLLRSPGGTAADDRAKAGGLDSRILASFPTIPYSAVKGMQEGKCGVECAVCLAEFSGSDAVRLLTVCCHAFHPACIDSWLDNHTTCPLCRSDLKAPPDEAAVIAVREVVDGNNGGGSRERTESHTITIAEEAAEERSRKSQSSRPSIAIDQRGDV